MPRKRPSHLDFTDGRSCRLINLSKQIAELRRIERSLNEELSNDLRAGAATTEARSELARILESIEQLTKELRTVEGEP